MLSIYRKSVAFLTLIACVNALSGCAYHAPQSVQSVQHKSLQHKQESRSILSTMQDAPKQDQPGDQKVFDPIKTGALVGLVAVVAVGAFLFFYSCAMGAALATSSIGKG